MLKRRWMAVETLLTFWPPAPWARMALISISWSGMETLVDIASIEKGLACTKKRGSGEVRPDADRLLEHVGGLSQSRMELGGRCL